MIFHFSLQPVFKPQKEKKRKIKLATSACCAVVVRNECKNHFSLSRGSKGNFLCFLIDGFQITISELSLLLQMKRMRLQTKPLQEPITEVRFLMFFER
jgi:hypothetical protein